MRSPDLPIAHSPDRRRRAVLGATAAVLGAYVEGRIDLHDAQAAVDRVGDFAMRSAPERFAGLLDPIKRLVNGAESLEGIRDGLDALPLDTAPLAEHLARALQAADEIGTVISKFEIRNSNFAETPFKAAGDWFRAQAMRIAGVAQADLLEAVKVEVIKALDQGTTLPEFQQALPALFDRHGYTPLHPWHVETIYRTNLQEAFGAARRRELQDPDVAAALPYWRYVAVLDDRTRPSHRALHGKIYRADDPVWDRIYPPWDFNCRCAVQPVSEGEMARRDWQVETERPEIDPGEGFGRGTPAAPAVA